MSIDRASHAMYPNLERPVPIIFWSPMEFIAGVCALGVGFMMDSMILGVVFCTLILYGSSQLQKGAKTGAMHHYLWRLGLILDSSFRTYFQPPWVLEFIE